MESSCFEDDAIISISCNDNTDQFQGEKDVEAERDVNVRCCFEQNDNATEKFWRYFILFVTALYYRVNRSPFTLNVETFLGLTTNYLDYYTSLNSATKYAIDDLKAFEILENIIFPRIAIIFYWHFAENVEETTMNEQ